MSASPPTPVQIVSPATADAMTPSATSRCSAAVPEELMPYEAAAKTVFVKANSLAAYHKATGTA